MRNYYIGTIHNLNTPENAQGNIKIVMPSEDARNPGAVRSLLNQLGFLNYFKARDLRFTVAPYSVLVTLRSTGRALIRIDFDAEPVAVGK